MGVHTFHLNPELPCLKGRGRGADKVPQSQRYLYIHSQFPLAEKQRCYLLFLQSSLIPWQEACLSSPLIVAFQYWEFLSEGGEKKRKQINMTVSTIELIKSLSAKNKANPILGPQFVMTSSTN